MREGAIGNVRHGTSETRQGRAACARLVLTCCIGALASTACAAAAPYLLRDIRPYQPDAATALLLHMDGALHVWIVHAGPEAYSWDMMNQKREKDRGIKRMDPAPFKLTRGEHTLIIKSHRTGARLDCIAITNYPSIPR